MRPAVAPALRSSAMIATTRTAKSVELRTWSRFTVDPGAAPFEGPFLVLGLTGDVIIHMITLWLICSPGR